MKPYVKRNKSDAADAEAICEAVTRPTMRFVPMKTAEQQSVVMLHWTRSLLVRQRTMLANAIRAHLAEFGIVTAQGVNNILAVIERLTATPTENELLPDLVAPALAPLVACLRDLRVRIKALEVELRAVVSQPQLAECEIRDNSPSWS